MRLFLLLTFLCATYANMKDDGDYWNPNNDYDIKSFNKSKRYRPEWTDLDTRPLPEWYDKAKIGVFLHWGVYSVPSFETEWFWRNWKLGSKTDAEFMKKNYKPGFTYQEFAPMFTAEFFDPKEWAHLFVEAGAKYVVLTSKHLDGFTLFPSKRSSNWNSVDVGPKRDLVGELAEAVRKENMTFGVCHTLSEWFNPIYLQDKKAYFTTQNYVDDKLWPEIKQLVNDYKPSLIWSEGDIDASDEYWRSKELLAWLYNDSPVKDDIVVNDRWGKGSIGKHGDFRIHGDTKNPEKLLSHKWEYVHKVDSKSWGYRRNMELSDISTMPELLHQVVSVVSYGGNILINVGPTKEGTIVPIFQERLRSLGNWLTINGEAIYGSSPWLHQNDALNQDVWYTCTKTTYNAAHPTAVPTESDTDTITAIYAISLKWPSNDKIIVEDIASHLLSGKYKIELLGYNGQYLEANITDGQAHIELPNRATVLSEEAWTLKFTLK